ncbi:hypothetical protein DOY81_012497, partial [Sarcophaga bullata]
YFNPSMSQFPFTNYNQVPSNTNSVFSDGLRNFNINPNASIMAGTSATTSSTNNQSYYDTGNSYSNFSTNGTTYYANPFATGFDFTNTKLQATAAEFVPRLNKLSLNETTSEASQQNKEGIATNSETHRENNTTTLDSMRAAEVIGDTKDNEKNLESIFEKEEKNNQRHDVTEDKSSSE